MASATPATRTNTRSPSTPTTCRRSSRSSRPSMTRESEGVPPPASEARRGAKPADVPEGRLGAGPPPARAGMLDRRALEREVAEGRIDTVVTAIPDLYGRLVGKRIHAPFVVSEVLGHGIHVCDYLMAGDMEMEATPGYAFASWATGYGDLHATPDLSTLRRAAWLERTAIVLCDVEREGDAVEVAPRTILRRQLERAAERGFHPL